MSAQFCLSVALAQQTVSGNDLKRFADPLLQPLIKKTKVQADAQLGVRSFILEVDLVNGQTLRHASHAVQEPFNWHRAEVIDNLHAMSEELPFGPQGIDRLAETVLCAERKTVSEIVSACVM